MKLSDIVDICIYCKCKIKPDGKGHYINATGEESILCRTEQFFAFHELRADKSQSQISELKAKADVL